MQSCPGGPWAWILFFETNVDVTHGGFVAYARGEIVMDRLMAFVERHLFYTSARIQHLEETLKYAVMSDGARSEVEHELRDARRRRDRTLAFKARRAARMEANGCGRSLQ